MHEKKIEIKEPRLHPSVLLPLILPPYQISKTPPEKKLCATKNRFTLLLYRGTALTSFVRKYETARFLPWVCLEPAITLCLPGPPLFLSFPSFPFSSSALSDVLSSCFRTCPLSSSEEINDHAKSSHVQASPKANKQHGVFYLPHLD